jgi:hypothetical protein
VSIFFRDSYGEDLIHMFASGDAGPDAFTELCDLLVAGGYFRARITGLSPFDKVAGGLAWGIQSSREAIDVEFVEDANIGHKVRIGENIEAALVNMECPSPLAAHQIQGLDCPQIIPVVQWLLKRVTATREETARSLRLYADLCFERSMGDFAAQWGLPAASKPIAEPPRRLYRRQDLGMRFPTAEAHVRSVLLEYGQKSQLLAEAVGDDPEGQSEAERERLQQYEAAELDKLLGHLGAYTAAQKLTGRDVTAVITRDQEGLERHQRAFEEKEQQLREELGLQAAGATTLSRLQAQIHELQCTVDERASALAQMQEEQAAVAARQEGHRRATQKAERRNARIQAEIDRVAGSLDPQRQAALRALGLLVQRNEKLAAEKDALVTGCKATLQEWRARVDQGRREQAGDDNENYAAVEQQHLEERARLNKVLAMVAQQNRDIDALQRQIDAIPTRAELVQYERRFVELYEQVQRTFAETKQHFVRYNTLSETLGYLRKEMDLLDSIHEKCRQVLGTRGAEQLPASVEQTADSVGVSKQRILDKLEAERRTTQTLMDACTALQARQRQYFTAVKELKEECHRNEQLRDKLAQFAP